MRKLPPEDFWTHVRRTESGCALWTGRIDRDGYGRWGARRAHCFAYEDRVEAIPPGLQIDHLCRNRACVEPTHLEAVTPRENTLRGQGIAARRAQQTHCIRGHAFTQENTYSPNGRHRLCRACACLRAKAYRSKKIAEVTA